MDILKALSAIGPFAALPSSLLEQLAPFASLRTVRAGETIFCQGEPSPYCFGILSGEILIQRVSRDRRRSAKVLSVLGPGALFGESSFFEETPRAAMASASQDGRLVVIAGQKLRQWIRQNPSPGMTLVMGLFQKVLERLEQTSRDLSLLDGIGRLLGGSRPLAERAAEALDFVKNSVDGMDAIFLYQRCDSPPRYEPLAHTSTLSELKALPVGQALVADIDAHRVLRVLHMPEDRDVLAGFPWIPDDFQSVIVFPLFDPADPTEPMQGMLVLACRRNKDEFSANNLLPFVDAARQFSQALLKGPSIRMGL